MTIVFICGSLEFGRDGVGDYTRRLAALLIKRGHQCFIIGLMDKFVSFTQIEDQTQDSSNIQCLRLPYVTGYKRNILEAKKWLSEIRPDWVSLQYVPFSFDTRGLALCISRSMLELIYPYKFHLMFHELWVGMNTESSLKLKIWGKAQKILINNFIRRTKPIQISTQSHLYLFCLKNMGVNASLVPLISNIPKIGAYKAKKNLNVLKFVVFGNIHHGAPVKGFAQDLQLYLTKTRKTAEIHFIGKGGTEVQVWLNQFELNGFAVKCWGEQDANTISELMMYCDYGIVSTPFILIDKSGSYAAMKEHGLPVVVLSRPWTVDKYLTPTNYSGVFEFTKESDLGSFISQYVGNKIESDLYDIASTFIASL